MLYTFSIQGVLIACFNDFPLIKHQPSLLSAVVSDFLWFPALILSFIHQTLTTACPFLLMCLPALAQEVHAGIPFCEMGTDRAWKPTLPVYQLQADNAGVRV